MNNGVEAAKPSMRLEPVYRKGYEGNRGKFNVLFKESFPQEYVQALLDRAKTKKDLKFRLIKEGENPMGLVVYSRKPSITYSLFGFEDALVVRALHVVPKFNRAVRQILIQTAHDMNAASIIIRVLKSNVQLKKDLVERSFRKIESLVADHWEIFAYDGKKAPVPLPDESRNRADKRDREEDEIPKNVKGDPFDPLVKQPKVEVESNTINE